MYLAVVVEAFSRKVVGWSIADHVRLDLVLGALHMALWNRRRGALANLTRIPYEESARIAHPATNPGRSKP